MDGHAEPFSRLQTHKQKMKIDLNLWENQPRRDTYVHYTHYYKRKREIVLEHISRTVWKLCANNSWQKEDFLLLGRYESARVKKNS